jgi:hypothetical protein
MIDAKIIRLQSGEDIIADVEQGEDHIIVKNPMAVIFKRLPTGKALMMMIPWIPLEIVEHNIASIHNEDILTVFEPNQSLITYYTNTIEQLDEYEQSLLSNSDDDIDIDEYDEEMSEDEFESFPIVSNKRIYH